MHLQADLSSITRITYKRASMGYVRVLPVLGRQRLWVLRAHWITKPPYWEKSSEEKDHASKGWWRVRQTASD